MRVHKKVLSRNTEEWISCAWDDCFKSGYELYKIRVHEGQNEYGIPIIVQYVFCTERHKQYWRNSHVSYGRLPAGYKLLVG